MKRVWILLLAVSLGLNAALLYVSITGHRPGEPAPGPAQRPAPREMMHRFMEERAARRSHRVPGEGPGAGSGDRPGAGYGPRAGSVTDPSTPGPEPSVFSDSLRQMRLNLMSRELGLRAEQRARLERTLDETMPEILEARAMLAEIRRSVFAQVQEPEIDASRVRDLVRELGRAQTRLDSLVAETILREAMHLDRDQRDAYFRAMPWHDPVPRHKLRGRRDHPR